MRQRAPNAVEISAYVDGTLSPRDVTAFESRMAEDAALRQRVDETRQVVAMMRAMPMRETPRNYLITPSMVTQARPSPAPRRVPLFAMRLATSLVALAFVVTSGLTLLQSGMTPRMAMAPSEAPQEALVEEFAASTVEVEAEVAALEAPAPAEDEMTLKAAEAEATPLAQGTLTPEEELALAPMPAEGEATGMGGGGEEIVEAPAEPAEESGVGGGPEEEADAAARSAPRTETPETEAPAAPEAEAPAEEAAIAVTEIADTEGAMAVAEAEQGIAEEAQPLAAMPPSPDGEINAEEEAPGGVAALDVADDKASARTLETQDAESGEMAREFRALSRPTARWAIGLGVATALLAAITLWMSRHRRG